MVSDRNWWRRLDERRRSETLSVDRLVQRLNISRATYYNWRADPERYPRDAATVELIAQFLHEDATALGAEMGRADVPSYASFVEAASARELSVRLYQGHVRAMAHAIGMSETGARHDGVDVVCRLLRDGLAAPPEPLSAFIGVIAVLRGRRRPEPYHHQIVVLPPELAGPAAASPSESAAGSLETLRRRVDAVLVGALLPVTREHSTELVLPLLRGRADVLLYPGLLDLQPPSWRGSSPDVTDVLVVGIYYSGAPDVGALLARALGHGFSTFEHLARLVQSAGLRGLPDEQLVAAAERVAQSVLAGESPTAGRTVWSTDDPRAVLGPRAAALLDGGGFPGRIVLLEPTEALIAYAAYRLSCVDGDSPAAEVVARWRTTLQRQQRDLVDRVERHRRGRDHRDEPIVVPIDLPSEVHPRADGGYDDEVDVLFDAYQDAAAEARDRLGAR